MKEGTPEGGTKAYDAWLKGMNALDDPLKEQTGLARTMWAKETAAAEKYNEPGRFTALIGYEWTSMPGGDNLHRNVVFRDGKDKADQIIPMSQYDSQDPERLWEWMAAYEQKTGGRLLAIPHNGNLSNGLMFDDVTLTTRKPLDRGYAERRMRWEPLYEVTQMKGDGETHPTLSPNDEFSNFERWDKASFGPVPKTAAMLPREYAREALQARPGLRVAAGRQPLQVRHGRLDRLTHLAADDAGGQLLRQGRPARADEGSDPLRRDDRRTSRTQGQPDHARETSASGLAGVWARDNTRESIWDAMARKEVYATTGTRLLVRVFGGFDFSAGDLDRSDFAEQGYARGVPMGGDLAAAPAGKAPTFMIRAVRDADGANLDRVQVIKGWLDAAGKTHEQVYDVAWSGGRKPGRDGKLPPVGNTVNVAEATIPTPSARRCSPPSGRIRPSIPQQRAFYYVRVIEIPTPRWTTFDAKLSASPCRRTCPRASRNAPTRRPSGTRREASREQRLAGRTHHGREWARILREPILQFLLIGCGLFAWGTARTSDKDESRIVVSQAVVDDSFGSTTRRGTGRRARRTRRAGGGLLHEEVLYREGVALGLDRDDR